MGCVWGPNSYCGVVGSPGGAGYCVSPSSCQNGKSMESSLAQVNKLLLPLLAPPGSSKMPASYTVEILSTGAGKWGGGVTTAPPHAAKLKKTPFAGPGVRAGKNSRDCRARTHSAVCEVPRPWFQTFQRGWGGDEFGCCCTPCPGCHVSMETREGQDVAHSEPGRVAGQAVGKQIPFHPSPARSAVPSRPPSSTACSTPFPGGAGNRPVQAGAAGVHSPLPGLTGNSQILSPPTSAAALTELAAPVPWGASGKCPHNSLCRGYFPNISAQTKLEKEKKL